MVKDILIHLVRLACRFYPFVSGQHRVSNHKVIKKLCNGKGIKLCKLPCGSLIYADLEDSDGRSVFFMGCNDAKVRLVINRIVRNGDTVIDVGANHGEHTIACSQLVGQTGFVHAIEPNPKLAEMIRKSVKANNISNAKVHELALSDKDGESSFYVNTDNSGAGCLATNDLSNAERIVVKVRKGDSFLGELGIEKVRLMVVDVEGHEEAIFIGAQKFLQNIHPEVILFESDERNVSFWDRGAVKALKSFGEYAFYEIPRTYIQAKVNFIEQGKPKVSGHDFLAVHKDCLDELEGVLLISKKHQDS